MNTKQDCDNDVFAVVEEGMLHSFTLDGWGLVQVLPSTVKVHETQEVREVPESPYSTRTIKMNVTVPTLGDGHRFLVKKDADAERARLTAECIGLRSDLTNQQNTRTILESKLKELEKTIENNAAVFKEESSMRKYAETNNRSLQEKIRNIESDLGKVREHIGGALYKEITGK